MNKKEIINLIRGRIRKLKKERDTLITANTKSKYNFVLGELMNLLLEINENGKKYK